MACASAHLCIGGNLGGLAFVSTDPTGGLRAWKIVGVHKRQSTGADTKVGCTRSGRALCVLVGNAKEWLVVAQSRSREHRGRTPHR